MAHKNHSDDSNPNFLNATPISSMIGRTITVIITNAIPLYGVTRLGWNTTSLVFLFVLEGIVVFFSDIVKCRFGGIVGTKHAILVFEFVFIFFFGFFAMLVFGPYASLEAAVNDRFRLIVNIFTRELPGPLMGIVFMRLVRLVHDLADSAAFGGESAGSCSWTEAGGCSSCFSP